MSQTIKLSKTALILLISFTAVGQSQTSVGLKSKCLTLKRFLEINHYQPLQWNDSASMRLYDKWMNVLDDDKVFFIKADIDQMQFYRARLDEEMNGKEWGFFDKTMQLYWQRLKEADSIIINTLSKPLDFSKPDYLHQPFEQYALSKQELQQRWQKTVKWKVLHNIASSNIDSSTREDDIKKIADNFNKDEIKEREHLAKKYALSFAVLKEGYASFVKHMGDEYLDAIAWCYDPHSNYMNKGARKDFETLLSANEYSAGIKVKQDENGYYEIEYLEPGGAAWKTGELHVGDVITKIKAGDEVAKETTLMDIQTVEDLLEGINGDKLEVSIKATGGREKLVTLYKEKMADDESIVKSYILHGEKNIGYIELPGFYSNEDNMKVDGCANDVSKEIIKLKKDTIAGLIIDLRYNGGGSMWEAIQLAGIFIDIGPMGSQKGKDGKAFFLKDPNRGTIYDGPLLLLINGQSASASEFTAAALQDYNRALIVGSTTYGKGTAQVILPMDTTLTNDSKVYNDNYEDFVKVTAGKFYRINGSTVQWKGVEPDITLPGADDNEDERESRNISALLPDNSKKASYQPLSLIPINDLKEKSKSRVNTSAYFLQINNFNNWLKENKKGTDIPLQWSSYMHHYKKVMDIYNSIDIAENTRSGKELKADNNNFDREKLKLATDEGKEINEDRLMRIESDKYINESCRIMQDWIKLINKP